LKKIIIFALVPFFLILLIIPLMIFSVLSSSAEPEQGITGLNVSPEVLAYRPKVEEYCKQFEISEYVNYLLAIMQVESGGKGADVMQSSESLGFPPNSINSPDKSIEQGCRLFAEYLKISKNLGCDMDTVIQSYNYGIGFLYYVSENGKNYTFEIACQFANERSNGAKVDYVNSISVDFGGWKYTYGNMFYVKLVKQYLFNTSSVSEFALQFVGENHSRFTSYQSKNSQAFGADWCAMFVSYCADQLGYIDSGKAFWFNGCTTAYNQMLSQGTFKYSSSYSGTYIPKAGDFIFFTNDYGQSSNHVGIVTGCDGQTVSTVEGNSGVSHASPYWVGSSVMENGYNINSYSIFGYYSLS
jgi:Cell wall-associated hydrolases (invasion-associated proteins)